MTYTLNQNAKIKGFITNLGKYNEMELTGKWISFPITDEELAEVKKEIGIDGKRYEECFFTDWDIDIAYCSWSYEFPNIEEMNETAEQVEELEESEFELLEAILEAECVTLEDALNSLERATLYTHVESLKDLAQELAEEKAEFLQNKDIDDFFLLYFDAEAYARTLYHEGYRETEKGILYTY